MTPRTKPLRIAPRAEMERREAWGRDLIGVLAGAAIGTGIAGLVAWHSGTLSYFIGGF